MLQSDWIIENYSACLYEERMREADCIVYFNFNRVNCLWAFRRYLTYREKTRRMAEGCNENLILHLKWILLDGSKICERYNAVVKIILTRQLF